MRTQANSDIRKKAKKGIDQANDTTVKMILAMLEVEEKEAGEQTEFEKEITRRFEEYEQGKIVPLTLDELEARVRKSHRKRIRSAK